MRFPWQKKNTDKSEAPGSVVDKGLVLTFDDNRVNLASLNYPYVNSMDVEMNSAVQACINWAARAVVEAPVIAESWNGSTWSRIEHEALQYIYPPNLPPSMPTFKRVLQGTMGSLIRGGDAYLPRQRKIVTYAHEDMIQSSLVDGKVVYRLNGNEVQDIIHIRFGVHPTIPWRGYSPIQSLARLISADNYAMRYMDAVAQKPYASTVFMPTDPDMMTPELAEKIKTKIASMVGGENSGGMVILNVPGDIKPIGLTPEDMGLTNFTRLSEERVCAVLGIPAVVVGLGAGLERSTFTNMQMAWNHALRNFMVPMWDLIADALTRALVNEPNVRLRFATEEVFALQEDMDSRHERVRKDYTSGLIPLSRAKELLGEQPQPGDEDIYYAAPNVQV
jgi:HK97 family phage portal protein